MGNQKEYFIGDVSGRLIYTDTQGTFRYADDHSYAFSRDCQTAAISRLIGLSKPPKIVGRGK